MDANTKDKNDEELAYLVQKGEKNVFGILIERYEVKIKRYARKFLYSTEDIDDSVQETFLKVYENIQSFDTKRKFSTWLYRIAHNEFVNTLKKTKRYPIFSFNFDTFLPHNISKENPANNFEKNLYTKDLVEKYLDKIDRKYREPLILFYLEELDYKEISDVMKIPVSTVGIRIKRAKEKIKKLSENGK